MTNFANIFETLKEMTRMHPNQSLNTLISCLTTLTNSWQSVAFLFIMVNTETHKTFEQKFIFQIGTLNPQGINERFSFY